MSTNMYYEVVHPHIGQSLGDGLKWVIQRRFGDEHIFDSNDLSFLEGVSAAQSNQSSDTARDCDRLMEAIRQHGAIRVWIE